MMQRVYYFLPIHKTVVDWFFQQIGPEQDIRLITDAINHVLRQFIAENETSSTKSFQILPLTQAHLN
jgi:hypothetical protein